MLRCSQRFHAIWRAFRRLRTDSRGVTALEYALIGATMAAAIVSTIRNVSEPIKSLFNAAYNALFHSI